MIHGALHRRAIKSHLYTGFRSSEKILNFRDEEFKYWFGNSYLFDIDDDFASIVVTTKVHKTIITNFIEEIATVFEQIIGKKVGCHIFTGRDRSVDRDF